MTTAPEPQLWSDEEYEAYALGMQAEREHQHALSRIQMRKHESALSDQRQQLASLQRYVDDLHATLEAMGIRDEVDQEMMTRLEASDE